MIRIRKCMLLYITQKLIKMQKYSLGENERKTSSDGENGEVLSNHSALLVRKEIYKEQKQTNLVQYIIYTKCDDRVVKQEICTVIGLKTGVKVLVVNFNF